MKFQRQFIVLLFCLFYCIHATAQPAPESDSLLHSNVSANDSNTPVILENYKAWRSSKTRITISWSTVSEEHNDYFRLERSPNGIDFTPIAIIRAMHKKFNYVQADEQPMATDNYYRLAQVDEDGHTTYFDVLKVRLNGIQGTVGISPNPVKDQLQLSLSGEEKGMVTVSVFNGSGLLMKQWMLTKTAAELKEALTVNDLQPGTYILQIKLNAGTETQQFVKQQ